jgi:hypothetical protein
MFSKSWRRARTTDLFTADCSCFIKLVAGIEMLPEKTEARNRSKLIAAKKGCSKLIAAKKGCS